MKRKPNIGRVIRILLISVCALIFAAGAAFAALFYVSLRRLNAEDRMMHAVRFIGFAQPSEFYEEILNCPDGFVQASELKTKIPLPEAADDSAPPGHRINLVGRAEHYLPYAGHVYVKKEGEWLCVAVITAPDRALLHPDSLYIAERFHLIESENSETGGTAYYCTGREEEWNIDAADMLKNGVPFHHLPAPHQAQTGN